LTIVNLLPNYITSIIGTNNNSLWQMHHHHLAHAKLISEYVTV